MSETLSTAVESLTSPPILFFGLGILAARLGSDLNVPDSITRAVSLYLIMAIGYKGGAQLRDGSLTSEIALHLLAGAALAVLLALAAYLLLILFTRLEFTDAVAVAAHYGSVSVVTFVTAAAFLERAGVPYEGHLVAMMAVMEFPGIVAVLSLSLRRQRGNGPALWSTMTEHGSVLLLIGSVAIGYTAGGDGLDSMRPFLIDPFQGVVAFFLLAMGLAAGQRLADIGRMGPSLILFSFYMPLFAATLGALAGALLGLSLGGTTLLSTLAASSSYIVAPSVVRLSLPEANPSLYLTSSLALTFPFNVTIGIPFYHEMSRFAVAQIGV